jgi:1-acyl-sn-glycerol-3-phosphate acyltransferase
MNARQRQFQIEYPYPRRRVIRYVLRKLIHLGFNVLTDFTCIGETNVPASGPLIVVANHFHFADGAAIIRVTPWPMEFLAGTVNPNAPKSITWLPRIWGMYNVLRGGASRNAMRASMAVLEQKGVIGIFPEGGNWAAVVRPARPGTAYLAVQTGAPLLPIGLDGLVDLFPSLTKGHRAKVTVRIGEPFAPPKVLEKGQKRRERLDAFGHEIMQRIANLLPPERQGVYSPDPAIRAAAQEVATYPYHDLHHSPD